MSEAERVESRVSTVDLENARAMLADGERQIGALLAQAEEEHAPFAAAPKQAESKAKPSKKEPVARERAAADAADTFGGAGAAPASEGASGGGRCPVACKALASMRRAADLVCELAGRADAQCSDAQSRVTRSQSTVERACPRCADAR
jgi:hypothetical protein